jgi:ABC-2 type transport system permease protein
LAVATSATFGAALTLVTWREKRILRRLRLAPVGTSAVVGARVGVSVLVAFGQTAIFLLVATTPAFGLTLPGTWWLLLPLALCGTLAFLALGLLAGAVARTAESASGIANLVILPMAFLSGSFFPLDSAPVWLRQVARVLPLQHLNDGMLDVLARGRGAAAVLPDMLVLLGFAAVLAGVAVRLFRWEDA